MLVPPEDPAALPAALAGLLADPERRARLGGAGETRASALFSPAAMVPGVRRSTGRGRWVCPGAS